MKKNFDLPQYGDVVYFTCLFYPLISSLIGFIILGIDNIFGIIAGSLMFCFLVYLPFASLMFACIRKKCKRTHACIISTFLGLMSVYFILGIIAYSLEGSGIGFSGAGLGFLILSMPYILCCGIYLMILKRKGHSCQVTDKGNS